MKVTLTVEQAGLRKEVEQYLEFERMHYEVTQTQLERDLLELYALHGMAVPHLKVRDLAVKLAEHRSWQEEAYDGDKTDEQHWWREGEQAGKALPDPDPSTHCTSRALWPGS